MTVTINSSGPATGNCGNNGTAHPNASATQSALNGTTMAIQNLMIANATAARCHANQMVGGKLPPKPNARLGPSPFRQLLPVALCVISFATVLSILIIYMDTTGELKLQFFSLFSFSILSFVSSSTCFQLMSNGRGLGALTV